MDLNNISTVLFDFDGVLMQSIEDHYRSWNDVFRTYDREIGWEEFSVLEGQSLFAIAEQLCRHHGIAVSESEKIGRMKNEIYLQKAKFKLYDGAMPLLDFLKKKNVRQGLVTGAHRDRFEKSVDGHFRSYFDAIVTADDVVHTKPHPEPFLKAASFMSAEIRECMVVENAPLGITAAKRAGMLCIAIASTLPEQFLTEADLILNNLNELSKLFESVRIEGNSGK
ncbi:HAD family phosphatase [bacterium]|nr:HAD family phosphatase [bacterium]